MVFDTLILLTDWNRWQCELCGIKLEIGSKISTPSEKSEILLGHIKNKHVKHLEEIFNMPFNQIDDKDKMRRTYSGEEIFKNPLDVHIKT